MKRYLFNQIVAFDIAINALLGGSPYETISERCWRHRGNVYADMAIDLIDWIFSLFGQVDHCKNADEGNEADYEVWG